MINKVANLLQIQTLHPKAKLCGIVFLCILLLLIGLFFLVYLLGLSPKQQLSATAKEEEGEIVYVEDPDHVLPGALLAVPKLTINLGKTENYLLVTIKLEFFDLALPEEVDKKMPVITDAIISVASAKDPQEILTLKGKELLRNELITKINQRLSKENQIVNLYFEEFTIS